MQQPKVTRFLLHLFRAKTYDHCSWTWHATLLKGLIKLRECILKLTSCPDLTWMTPETSSQKYIKEHIFYFEYEWLLVYLQLIRSSNTSKYLVSFIDFCVHVCMLIYLSVGHTCIHACVSVCVYVCVWTCNVKATGQLHSGVFPEASSKLFEEGLSHWLWIQWLCKTYWLRSPRDPPVSVSSIMITSESCHGQHFTLVLGIEFRSSCWHGKHFIGWANSQL